jgi:tRNA (guanine37-N1)-methyltransferase
MTNSLSIDVLSLFPEVVGQVLSTSIMRRAQLKGTVTLEASDLRKFSEGPYRAVDDTPFGGGQGMLFSPEVLERALHDQLQKAGGIRENLRVIYPSPKGLNWGNKTAWEMARWLTSPAPTDSQRRICLIAGRYEGIDDRINQKWVDLEVSLGDFVLTGGELPSLCIVDSIVRLLPGVLGNVHSAPQDSFEGGLLEGAQYTKPRDFQGLQVPESLLSGHHQKIEDFKLRDSLLLTYALRPDLIEKHQGEDLPDWARTLLETLKKRLHLRGLPALDL